MACQLIYSMNIVYYKHKIIFKGILIDLFNCAVDSLRLAMCWQLHLQIMITLIAT